MQQKNGYQKNIVALGLVSFWSGLSQDMINSIFPIFLTSLGFTKEFIGFLSGLVTSVSSIFKILAGYISDKLRHRKWIVFIGYALSVATRPLLGIFSAGASIIGLRFADAVGKGTKDAPRDALVAESSPVAKTGRSFGLHRMLDTFGSVAGPLVVVLLLKLFGENIVSYKKIFLLTAIPGAIALFIIAFFVRETARLKKEGETVTVKSSLAGIGGNFYFLLFVIVIFSLGNSTDAFILLRAQNLGLSIIAIPLVYAAFYFFYAILSYPIGILSDRIGKKTMIVAGWGIYGLSYLGFALANRAWQVWPLFIFYGLFYAATEGSGRALTADIVKPAYHGLAFGLYNTAIAITALPASIFAGYLWDRYSPAAAFYLGSITALAAIVLFGIYSLIKNRKSYF